METANLVDKNGRIIDHDVIRTYGGSELLFRVKPGAHKVTLDTKILR